MLKYVEEFGKHVEIGGIKSVKMGSTDDFLKAVGKTAPSAVTVQFFDAKIIATWEHLYFAVINALTAFNNGANISKSLAMEIMLFASAQRQIRKATELAGIKSDSSEIAIVLVGDEVDSLMSARAYILMCSGGHRDDNVLELSPDKVERIREVFKISATELETLGGKCCSRRALVDLVIERAALVATKV